MLDELSDLDEERLAVLYVLMRKKRKSRKCIRNKKVRSKTFMLGDLVWKVILPIDKKDRTLGKWSPNWERPFRIL